MRDPILLEAMVEDAALVLGACFYIGLQERLNYDPRILFLLTKQDHDVLRCIDFVGRQLRDVLLCGRLLLVSTK